MAKIKPTDLKQRKAALDTASNTIKDDERDLNTQNTLLLHLLGKHFSASVLFPGVQTLVPIKDLIDADAQRETFVACEHMDQLGNDLRRYQSLLQHLNGHNILTIYVEPGSEDEKFFQRLESTSGIKISEEKPLGDPETSIRFNFNDEGVLETLLLHIYRQEATGIINETKQSLDKLAKRFQTICPDLNVGRVNTEVMREFGVAPSPSRACPQ